MSNPLPSFGELMQTETLPSPPTIAVEILRLTRDENVGMTDLAEVIARDPALAGKLMKLANSSLFSRGAPVTSIDQAMMRLGTKTVKLMALSFSLVRPAETTGGDFPFDELWQRAVVRAVAGRSLATKLELPIAEEAFLCGLLSRIGQLVLSQHPSEVYRSVREQSKGNYPDSDDERGVLGYDHAEVGGALLQSWELPEAIHQAVRCSVDPLLLPEDASEEAFQLTTVVSIARDIEAVLRNHEKAEAVETLSEKLELGFGMGCEEATEFLLELEPAIRITAEALEIEIQDGSNHASIVEQARNQMMQISLGVSLDLNSSESKNAQLERDKEELARISVTDKMTGIHNRAFFDEQVQREVEETAQKGGDRSLGLLVLDVDKFKLFNDTHGHLVGDEVLKAVARVMKKATPDQFYTARYGGEEFVVIMPETNETELNSVAETIRKAIEAELVEAEGKTLSVTASIGGAMARGVTDFEKAEALLKTADGFLYEAKEGGRNRCVCRTLEGASNA